ncbi:MAG: 4-hydroxy-tetrahydrodipicolinate reductase [Dehalococcoidales bacterium]
MRKIKVIVHGARGRMGQTVVGAVQAEQDMELVCGIDTSPGSLNVPTGNGVIPVYANATEAIDNHQPDVVVDFSLAHALLPLAREVLSHKVRLVSGTTGIDSQALDEIKTLAKKYKTGVIYAANFAIASVMMMHLSRIASPYFDHAEIIELHHEKKADAPSGTALSTAKGMIDSRGKPFIAPDTAPGAPSRGLNQNGITIHSVRLPGILARQEIIFGAPGQTLTISSDTVSRDCYMPGVIMAIRRAMTIEEMVTGLDILLGLQEAACNTREIKNTG